MIMGEIIYLSALNNEDKNKILEWVNKPEIKIMVGTLYPISDFEHNNWFDSIRLSDHAKYFGIRISKTNSMIGLIGLKNIDFISRSAELFMYIANDRSQGQGYGSDALKTLVDFAFNDMNLHRIYLRVFSYNIKAINLYEKLGFVNEGTLKDSLYRKGEYHDVKIMAKLKGGEV